MVDQAVVSTPSASRTRTRLEPLGEGFKGRKPVTLDFEREEAALRIFFDLVFEADIVKPAELRRKLRNQAKRVVAATT